MSDVQHQLPERAAGSRIKGYRDRAGISLEELADRIQQTGVDRPSTAKLSRIENGLQPIQDYDLAPLVTVTGIPARLLRPDLAKLFGVRPRSARRVRHAA